MPRFLFLAQIFHFGTFVVIIVVITIIVVVVIIIITLPWRVVHRRMPASVVDWEYPSRVG